LQQTLRSCTTDEKLFCGFLEKAYVRRQTYLQHTNKNERHEQRKTKIERLQQGEKQIPLLALFCLLYSCLIESVTRKARQIYSIVSVSFFASLCRCIVKYTASASSTGICNVCCITLINFQARL
jgi:hypothetical protein